MKDRFNKLEWNEWHSFVCGFGDGACPFADDTLLPMCVFAETWYYKAGKACGSLSWPVVIGLVILIVRWVS